MPKTQDAANMSLALALGKRGLGQCWPNPSVGAVVAEPSGRIVSCGWTGSGGRPHAEAIALAQAGDAARGATLYATLEPCAHWGKTPPCVDTIISAGIARVVYGVVDPDPRVAGRGVKKLRENHIEVVQGPFAAEARWQTLGHELRVTARRPFMQLKLAVDGDGMVPAGGGGMPVWATGQEARALSHLIRAEADAIMVGYGTVLADDPDLTCRLPGLSWRSPVRVILSTDGRFSRYSRMLKNLSTAPLWIFTAADVPQRAKTRLESLGATVITVAKNPHGRLDLHAVVYELAERGITRLLVEGGPSLEMNLLRADLADEILIFQGAKETVGPALMPFAPAGLDAVTDTGIYSRAGMREIGGDRVWVYRRAQFWNG
ncbi:MAG: bifunctional diaminohydroxyphosphoribosylaminopyrimidine deaminase/5-amino-6-(5-phosphoribosylamino)uracil reductase RibD [Rhodomicrobiaceae bacterium]